MTILVFDIETIPDLTAGRRLYDLHNLSDAEVGEAMFALRRAKTGSDFLPHHLQRVIAISAVLVQNQKIKVWSLGDEDSDESEIIQRFFQGIDKLTPVLISWNGSGFDLPVLHYRAMVHQISAPTYWEMGEQNNQFKWNNYISRYHYRHLDLMDIISSYNPRAVAPLDEVSSILGYPGKMGMSGAKVWESWLLGNIKGIRDYCETDVLNTYCVYLRFELMRGQITHDEFIQKEEALKAYLQEQQDKPHFQEFLTNLTEP